MDNSLEKNTLPKLTPVKKKKIKKKKKTNFYRRNGESYQSYFLLPTSHKTAGQDDFTGEFYGNFKVQYYFYKIMKKEGNHPNPLDKKNVTL